MNLAPWPFKAAPSAEKGKDDYRSCLLSSSSWEQAAAHQEEDVPDQRWQCRETSVFKWSPAVERLLRCYLADEHVTSFHFFFWSLHIPHKEATFKHAACCSTCHISSPLPDSLPRPSLSSPCPLTQQLWGHRREPAVQRPSRAFSLGGS